MHCPCPYLSADMSSLLASAVGRVVSRLDFPGRVLILAFYWSVPRSAWVGGGGLLLCHAQSNRGPDLGARLAEGVRQLLLYDVDAHGGEGQPEDEVDYRRHHVHGMLRYEVAKTNSGHGDKDEVEGLKESPFLPYPVDGRPDKEVDQEDDDGH